MAMNEGLSPGHDCADCLTVKVGGLDCAEEVALLRKALAPQIGGPAELSFDLLRGTFTVHRPPAQRDDAAIIHAVKSTGLRPETGALESARHAQSAWRWADRRILASAVLSLAALLLGYGIHIVFAGPADALLSGEDPPDAAVVCFVLAVLAVLAQTTPKAIAALRFLRPDMHLLMTIAILGALALREFSEAATVSFLFAASLLLESWNLERARRSVAALMDLAPAVARVKCPNDGCLSERPVESVALGETVVVRPGERIPLDGEIILGATTVDQAAMTGESMPEARGVGEGVLAGTINLTGEIALRVERASGDTLLARMMRLVESARSRRAPAEQWVDRFARWYTPAMMALALAMAILPPLAGGAWGLWTYRALVVLVIACPCALVISTPVAITAALSSAARRGVLIKGGIYLEQMAGLRGIAFDKTGTLTLGTPAVAGVFPAPGVEPEALLAVAAALEQGSGHPLAQAILAHAAAQGIVPRAIANHQAIHGQGITAELDGETCWAGNERFARQWTSAPVPQALPAATLVYAGRGQRLLGAIALRDTPRPEARAAIAALRATPGLRELRMLSGDRPAVAEALAREVGIEGVEAGLSPEQKVEAVAAMAARLGSVAMVGDGVNDAPALAAATVGIAMAGAGTDAALETADIALMEDRIERIPWLVHHARKAKAIIIQNITFALGTKALFLLLTALGLTGLWGAIAADMGASLLVLFNALRLLRG